MGILKMKSKRQGKRSSVDESQETELSQVEVDYEICGSPTPLRQTPELPESVCDLPRGHSRVIRGRRFHENQFGAWRDENETD